MGIRSSLGVIVGFVVFFVGLVAIGMQANIVKPRALNSTANGSSAAYNTTTSIFEGLGAIGGQAVPIVGMVMFLLVCVGLLVVVYGGAR